MAMSDDRGAAARAVIEEALTGVLEAVVGAFDAGFARAIQAGRTESEASAIASEAAAGAPSWAWVRRDGGWRIGVYEAESYGYGRDTVPRKAGYVWCLSLEDFIEGGMSYSPDAIEVFREIAAGQAGDLVEAQIVETLCAEWQKASEGHTTDV